MDIITAAMGHALASVGGFCTGSAKVVDHQVQEAHVYYVYIDARIFVINLHVELRM